MITPWCAHRAQADKPTAASQRETAEDSMKRLGEAVLSVKNAVKRLHTQPEEPLVDTSPDYKKAVFRFLMAESHSSSTAHAVSGGKHVAPLLSSPSASIATCK